MEDNTKNGPPPRERIEMGSRITEIERSGNEALQESEERFRAIFDSVNDAIFIHDLETGAIVDVNQRMCEMYGFTHEEALRLRATDSSSGEPPYAEQDALNWVRKAATGEPQLFEWLAKHKTGRLFWVEVNMNRATIGKKERLVVTVRDITEREKAEAALRESERRYAGLFEALRDGFVSVLMNGRIVETNPFFRSMVGYSEEELNSMTYEELTPEKWHSLEENIVQEQVLKRGYSEVYEKEYIRKDGTVFPLEIRTHLLRDENGEPVRMWGFVRDITDRKQAEETLQEYLKAVEGSEDMIATIDRDYRYCLANTAFLRYRGMGKEQVIGRSAAEILGKDVFEKIVKGNLDKCFRGEVVHYEMKHTYPELGDRELLISYWPIGGPHGIDRVTTLIRDMTEQRYTEAELKRSEEKYRSIFENAVEGIFQTTPEGRYLSVNPSLARMYGYDSPEEMDRHRGTAVCGS
jgi:PAS domain S-box-containing protein